MKYIESLKTYSANLPKEWETELLVQIKKMRAKGFSYQWIEKAITHKKLEEWQKWGFGLLHTEAYQKQINNLLIKEQEQIRDIDVSSISWDDLEKDVDSNQEQKIKAKPKQVIRKVPKYSKEVLLRELHSRDNYEHRICGAPPHPLEEKRPRREFVLD